MSRLKRFFGSLEISSEQYLCATATLEAAYHLSEATVQDTTGAMEATLPSPSFRGESPTGIQSLPSGLASSTSQTPCEGRHREMACLVLSPLPVSPLEFWFLFSNSLNVFCLVSPTCLVRALCHRDVCGYMLSFPRN